MGEERTDELRRELDAAKGLAAGLVGMALMNAWSSASDACARLRRCGVSGVMVVERCVTYLGAAAGGAAPGRRAGPRLKVVGELLLLRVSRWEGRHYAGRLTFGAGADESNLLEAVEANESDLLAAVEADESDLLAAAGGPTRATC